MNFSFDFISDLHVRPEEEFSWSGQQTSLYCVVAGDLARDRETLLRTLRSLSTCYMGVLYIDGNAEHRDYLSDLDSSYKNLITDIEQIPGVIYLHNNVVVVEGVAFVGVNGWWCYNFDETIDYEKAIAWYCSYTDCTVDEAMLIADKGYSDAAYLSSTIINLQKHKDIKSIVVVSHTMPTPYLATHDMELFGTYRFNSLGNQHLFKALNHDTQSKVTTWCFGHYHRVVDREIANIQFITNPRGRTNTPWCQNPYYPKRIEITLPLR